jgi:hypothetical protein
MAGPFIVFGIWKVSSIIVPAAPADGLSFRRRHNGAALAKAQPGEGRILDEDPT